MVVLVDVVKMALESENWDVLTIVADTISFNVETFSVLHSVEDFEQRLYTRVCPCIYSSGSD